MAEIKIEFATVGDDDALGAIKTVTKHVNTLKKISATDLNMKSITDAISGADLKILQDVVNKADRASKAMQHLGIEYERTAKKMKSPFDMGMDNANFMNAFSTKDLSKNSADFTKFGHTVAQATEEAAKGINHLGIEYDKTKGKMKSPLSSGMPDASFASQFTAKAVGSDVKGKVAYGEAMPGDKMAGNRMAAFAMAAGKADVKQYSENIVQLNKHIKETEQRADAAKFQLGLFGRILAGMAVRAAVRHMLEFADSFTNLQNKIKTVTDGTVGSLSFISKELTGIAQESRTSLGSVVTAYSRTSRAVAVLGKSQTETLQFTETLSKAIQVGGATSVEASNAMVQLSQGMSSGALRGDELRSVLEQLPIVAQLIADKMGVTVGELRKLGAAGKITTDVVFEAITGATDKVNEKFGRMELTLSQAFIKISNAATQWAGNLSGLMKGLAEGVNYLANNFDTLMVTLRTLALSILPILAVRWIPMLTNAVLALNIAVKANPWVAVATAIASVIAALIPFISKMKQAEDSIATFGDEWTARWRMIVHNTEDFIGRIGLAWDSLKESLGIYKEPPALEGLKNSLKDVAEEMQGVTNAERKMRLERAKAADNFMLAGPLAKKRDPNWIGPGEMRERALIAEMDKIVGQRVAKRLVAESAEAEARIRDERYAGATTIRLNGGDEKKPKTESGKTMAEQLREAQQEADQMIYGRFDGKKKTIDNRVYEQTTKMLKELSNSQQNLVIDNPKLMTQLEDIIRIKETWKDVYQLIEETEKAAQDAMKAEWDSFAKELDETIKKTEEAKKTVLEFQEAKADRETARHDKFKGITEELQPEFLIQTKIKDLEEYEKFAQKNGLADWAREARDAIKELQDSMKWYNTPFQTFSQNIDSLFGQNGTLVKGLSDVTANAIVAKQSIADFGRALKDILTQIEKQVWSSLIQIPLNMGIGALSQAFAGPSPEGTGLPGGGTSKFGYIDRSDPYATNPYNTGTTLDLQPTPYEGLEGVPGFSSGGYTGNKSTSTAAGVVHGQEYVLNASATRRMGKENLDVINKGGSVAPKATAPNIVINNNAGVDVQAVVSPTTGEIEVMIERKVAQRVDTAVANRINDPNSRISRAMSQNIEANRRRY